MDYLEVSDSPIAWSWVIEALATHRGVELDLLCDLIKTTPTLSDNLNEAAREMVALRNLEGLYDPAKVLNSGVPLSSDQEEIQFDSSECFSHVLQRVMEQKSVSSLKKDGSNPLPNVRKGASDKLMRDIHAFLERRKASMPKCYLQELSDVRQNDEACHETDLKRKWSCLQTQERMQDCIVDAQSGESSPEKKLRHDNNGSIASTEQNTSPLISSDMQDCPIDVQSGESLPGNKLRHDRNGSIASTEQNLAPLISSDMQDCPADVQSGLSPPGKKLRHDSNGSIAFKEQNSPPMISSGMQDCPVDGQSGKSPPRRKLRHDSNGPIASTAQNSDPLISSDINQPCPLSWKPAQPIGLLTWWPSDVSNEDEKKNAENSSTPADSTDLDVCIKCNKGGEVLFCSVSSCPVVVHERCLSITESIDSRDDFLCPFCVCSSAKSEYAEAKERMLLARRKLSLFVSGNPDHQSKGFTEVNANPPRRGRVERTFKGKGVYQGDRASTDKQHEGHLARGNVHCSPPNCSSKQGEGVTANNCQFEKRFIIVNANAPREGSDERTFEGKGKDVYQAHRALTDEQHKGHLAPDNVHTSPPNCSSKEGEDITVKNCQLEKGKQMMPIEHFHYAGGYHGVRTRQQLDSLSKNASCASSGEPGTKNHTAKTSDNFLSPQSRRKLADQMQGASSASLDDSDGISEEENCTAPTSRDSQRVKAVYKARKMDRRIRVPWTEEEVEMLKEGMKRFGSEDMKIIPWTTILEFGSSVFWKGRTGGNLKDKWRNLVKANPELRRWL